MVGFESDPTKFGDNRVCPESVGLLDGVSDSGYFICGLWGNVLVVVQDMNPAYVLQIMELRAYSHDHLSSLADPAKVKSSCGPGHCIDLVAAIWNYKQSPEQLLLRRRITFAFV